MHDFPDVQTMKVCSTFPAPRLDAMQTSSPPIPQLHMLHRKLRLHINVMQEEVGIIITGIDHRQPHG